MADSLTAAILRTHQAERRLARLARGQLGPLSREVVAASADLRRLAGRLEAAATAAGVRDLDPVEAVAIVVDAAIAAGADWQAVVAAVTRAGERR